MTRKPAIPQLTPGQAEYVVLQAVADRKLTYNDVVAYLAQVNRDIRELEGRLEDLRAVAGPPANQTTVRRPRSKRGKRAPIRLGNKRDITPERRASMKLQGQYLGLLQRMPEARKAAIKRLAREVGREAAIALMKKDRERASKR